LCGTGHGSYFTILIYVFLSQPGDSMETKFAAGSTTEPLDKKNWLEVGCPQSNRSTELIKNNDF
jgi:hypothetical protein